MYVRETVNECYNLQYRGVAQLVARVVWDHEAAGSKPVTRTRKSAEIIRFQRVSYVNYSIFSKSYSLIIAAQDLRCGFGKLEFYLFSKSCNSSKKRQT